MGIDATLKRFFPIVLCVLIAAIAYFQASGIGRMVASSVATPPGSADVTAPPPPRVTPAHKDGNAILARNAFDSVTGPLDGSQAEAPREPEPVAASDAETSDDDPNCGFGRVILISASEDPAWSFASIADQGGKATLRRVGDTVGSHTVQAMAWDRVWLADTSKKTCKLVLGAKSEAPAAAARSERSTTSARRSNALPSELASKIHRVSDTEFNVERSVVDEILENQAQLMRSARIVPEKNGDQVVGIKLFGIRSGTLLHTLGLQNGDRLESINGFDMSDPQKALEAYGRLRTANKLEVKVNRGGSPMTIDFNIQ